MTTYTDHELDRILDQFLGEGPGEAPDRAIDLALDRIDHVRQRRTGLSAGWARMPATARLLLAAAACFVLAAVLIFGVIAITGGIPVVAMPASIIGRLLAISSVVLLVLAVVRKLDSIR